MKLREKIKKMGGFDASDRRTLLKNKIYKTTKRIKSITDPEKLLKANKILEESKEEIDIIESIYKPNE